MQQMESADSSGHEPVITVDLFAGCGGLSLGFDLFKGETRYSTVLALDNNRQAVRCYNANERFVKGRSDSAYPTARLCDLTWFHHPHEVLLFYLAHLAAWREDVLLQSQLQKLGFRKFLASLREIDRKAGEAFAALSAQDDYHSAFAAVDPRLASLAISKTFQSKLGFASLKTLALSKDLIWSEDCEANGGPASDTFPAGPMTEVREGLKRWLEAELAKLRDCSKKSGRGQNSVVAERLRSLTAFLDTSVGKQLLELWLDWRAARDSMRASFVIEVAPVLSELYSKKRQVRLLLGGPPCKGFSRIGRAVIVSLREQGVHAWASHEYGDERNALLHKYVLFLEALRPEAFIFENVAHFGSALKTPKGLLDASQMLEDAISTLSSSRVNYHVSSSILRAREFGIPQDRSRFIMFGVRADCGDAGTAEAFFELPRFQNEVPLLAALQGLGPPLPFGEENETVVRTNARVSAYTLVDKGMSLAYRRFIDWIRQPVIGHTASPKDTDAHVYRRMRPDDLALLEKFGPGQRWMDYKISKSTTLAEIRRVLQQVLEAQIAAPDSAMPSTKTVKALLEKIDDSLFLRLLLEQLSDPLDAFGQANHLLNDGYLAKGADSHGDWFERLSALRPCKTIVAHIGKDTYGYFHPYENRAISIREAARVQAFPDFFEFGSVGVVDGYSMIGNAVPPLLASFFAARAAELIFDQNRLPSQIIQSSRRPRQQALIEI